jgi:hypothetical protein
MTPYTQDSNKKNSKQKIRVLLLIHYSGPKHKQRWDGCEDRAEYETSTWLFCYLMGSFQTVERQTHWLYGMITVSASGSEQTGCPDRHRYDLRCSYKWADQARNSNKERYWNRERRYMEQHHFLTVATKWVFNEDSKRRNYGCKRHLWFVFQNKENLKSYLYDSTSEKNISMNWYKTDEDEKNYIWKFLVLIKVHSAAEDLDGRWHFQIINKNSLFPFMFSTIF